MSYNSLRSKKTIDWIALTVFISLAVVGWMMLFAASYDDNAASTFSLSSTIGRQSIWLLISIIAFAVTYVVDSKVWSSLALPSYVLSLLLLIGVLIFGSEIKGAKSWYDFGFFSFQPSELAKLTTALAVSSFFGSYRRDINKSNDLLFGLGIILAPMLLILLQPDAGSALIFISFFILFFRLGLPVIYYIIGLLLIAVLILSIMYSPLITTYILLGLIMAILIFNIGDNTLKNGIVGILVAIGSIVLYSNNLAIYGIVLLSLGAIYYSYLIISLRKTGLLFFIIPLFFIFTGISFGTNFAFEKLLKPHQQDRINVWLKPEKCDPHGSLYNIIQSKLAIGSGGIQGKGFLKGNMTKLNYVPEQTTDFIFSTIGEEQGFIGTLGVIALFMMLLFRIIFIGERARSKFIRCYAYSVAGIIFFHFFLNIGMTLGIMPVIGIPLPFISKGGSSLLIFTVMIAILLKMDAERLRTSRT